MNLADSIRRNDLTCQLLAYTGSHQFQKFRKSLDEIEREYGEDARNAFADLKAAVVRVNRLRGSR